MNKPLISRIFLKYLFSYTIAFIIPVVILGTVLYDTSSSILENQIDDYSYNMLNSAQQSIDSRLQELNHIASQISNITDLRDVKYSRDFFSIRNAISNIHNITVTNNFIHETFLYYKNQDLIYGSGGTYKLDHFLNIIYRYEHWDREQFISDIQNLNQTKMRPAEIILTFGEANRNNRYLTYIVPIPYGNTTTDGVVFFTVQEEVFKKLFLQVLPTPNSLVFVFDNHNQPLMKYGENESINAGVQYLRQNAQNFSSKRVFWNETEYSTSAIRSKNTGWTYIVAIPIHEIAVKMQPVTNMTIIVFFIVILSGTVIILILTKVNYKPISDLTHFALKGVDYSLRKASTKKGYNELETVKQAVSHMNDMIYTLQQKVKHTVPIMKKTYLTRLIRGYYQDLDSANSQASELGMLLPQGSYCVAVCLLSAQDADEVSNTMDLIESLTINDLIIYTLDGLDQNHIILLLINPHTTNINLNTSISSLINSFKHALSINMTIGIGNWVFSTSEIGSSYIQASTALDYRFIKGRDTITFYEELENNIKNLDYNPQERLNLLEMHILHGNIKETVEILCSIFNDIKSREFPIFHVRSFCYNIINSVLNALYKMKRDLNIREYQYLDIITLVNSQTIDELHKKTEDICLAICTAVYEYNNQLNAGRIKEMIDYINSHYLSTEFSVNSMAAEFGMSPSGLSTYFKSQTSENVSNYVNRLRIEKAKKLLEETSFNLQEIVQEVGYFNVSSFIRKFKQYTKVTPGVYRSLLK